MKKIVVGITALIFLSAASLGVYIYQYTVKELATAAKCPPTVTGIKSVPFKLTYKAIVKKVPKDAKRLDIWMPYPKNARGQIITNVSVKSPYPVEVNHEKKYGNAIMHIGIDNPKKNFDVTMDISAIREEVLSARLIEQNVQGLVDIGNFKTYMTAERVGQITPLIEGLAEKATRGNSSPIDKAKAIYNYINGNYQYDFQKKYLPKERGYLPHVCSVLKGRCTEFSTLFNALARAEKIPARTVVGFTFKNAKPGKIDGYCCWSEFYVPGYGWVPADNASAKKFPKDEKYYFGNLDENRLEMVEGRDIKLVPEQKGKNINLFIYPYAEIDGKEFEVDKSISWENEL